MKIIQQLRNEAHRFGITHHRNKRSKSALNSELNQINGIGDKTILSLLKHFKSVKRVTKAPLNDLTKVIGKDKANKIYNYYHSK